ncbi:MAG: FecR domain-containing protein [Pseudomonadota bacterium]
MTKELSAQTSDPLLDAALRWHVRLNSGDADAADFDAFSDWLDEDPAHFAAYTKVDELEAEIKALADSDLASRPTQTDVSHAKSPARRFWFTPQIGMALAAGLAIAVAVSQLLEPPALEPDAVSLMADVDTRLVTELEDGSVVTLAPGAMGMLLEDDKGRTVRDFSGAGYFDVASNPEKPFKLLFEGGQVEVLGTQFEVSAFEGQVYVAVDEGAVRLNYSNFDSLRLEAGEGHIFNLEFPEGRTLKTSGASRSLWSSGAMTFEGASVEAVLDRLNLIYGPNTLRLEGTKPNAKPFSGIIPVRSLDQTARIIGDLLDLDVEIDSDGAIFRVTP